MGDEARIGMAGSTTIQNRSSAVLVMSSDRDLIGRLLAREAVGRVVRQQDVLPTVVETDVLPELACDIGSAQGITGMAPLLAPTSLVRRKPIARMLVNDAIARVVRRQPRLQSRTPTVKSPSRDHAAAGFKHPLQTIRSEQPSVGKELDDVTLQLPRVVTVPATTSANYWVYAGSSIPGVFPTWVVDEKDHPLAGGIATARSQTYLDVAELPDGESGAPIEKTQPPLDRDLTPRAASKKPVDEKSHLRIGFHYIKRAAKVGAVVLVSWLVLMAFVIALYRFVNPPMSSLMVQHAVAGKKVVQRWRSLDKISPHLVRAVIVSEDWRFCQHYGIDLKEIEAAIARSRNGIPRGASTITMQAAKNLFLWPAKSYIRKALEVPLTWMMELFLPKWRIAEIYLNIVEWGPGVFGAEAAARHHFKKPASKLTRQQSALLAVSLPSPRTRKAGVPGRRLRRMAGTVRARMRQVGTGVSCILDR
ncbi:MAG: monofunctional biosynthetic peptidoglycan transglycosylase [Hyphomicrobiaceae bacterium]